MAVPEAVSSRGMKNQVRIRGPKPTVSFKCESLDQLEVLLKKHIDLCKNKPIPETVYAQFIFESDVVFKIKDTSDEIRDHFPNIQAPSVENGYNALPVTEAVAQVPDARTKLRRQRAVGRVILRSIQEVDAFNYFEKEAWDTKHADGYRFKYLCKDSYQNKDRANNKARKSLDPASFQPVNGGNGSGSGGAGTADHSGDQSPAKGEVSEWFKKYGLTPPAAESPARLPTYDCKGSIFVKFSSSQQMVDVVYQHLPIHNVTNERSVDLPSKPLPAFAHNGTSHYDSGDPMDTSEMASYTTPQAATPVAAPVADATKAKKRKRTSKPARESLVEAETSDIEALDDEWELENQAPPPPLVAADWEPDPGDGDLWRPSVCTIVPAIKAQMKQPVRKSYQSAVTVAAPADDSSASGSDFEGGGGKTKMKKKAAPKAKAKTAAAGTNNNPTPAFTSTANAVAQDSDRGVTTRRRTNMGCWTCRQRKLKCDEVRPQCTQCARSRPPRECVFPEDDDDMSDAPP